MIDLKQFIKSTPSRNSPKTDKKSKNEVFEIPIDTAWEMRRRGSYIGNMDPKRTDTTMQRIRDKMVSGKIEPIKTTRQEFKSGILQDGKHRLIIARDLGLQTYPIDIMKDRKARNMVWAKGVLGGNDVGGPGIRVAAGEWDDKDPYYTKKRVLMNPDTFLKHQHDRSNEDTRSGYMNYNDWINEASENKIKFLVTAIGDKDTKVPIPIELYDRHGNFVKGFQEGRNRALSAKRRGELLPVLLARQRGLPWDRVGGNEYSDKRGKPEIPSEDNDWNKNNFPIDDETSHDMVWAKGLDAEYASGEGISFATGRTDKQTGKYTNTEYEKKRIKMSPDEVLHRQFEQRPYNFHPGNPQEDKFEKWKSFAHTKTVDKLKKAIMDPKEQVPVIIEEYDETGKRKPFQEGRHRALAAKELGHKTMPVIIALKKPDRDYPEYSKQKVSNNTEWDITAGYPADDETSKNSTYRNQGVGRKEWAIHHLTDTRRTALVNEMLYGDNTSKDDKENKLRSKYNPDTGIMEIIRDIGSEDMALVYHGTDKLKAHLISKEGLKTSKELQDTQFRGYDVDTRMSEQTDPNKTYYFDKPEHAITWAKVASTHSRIPPAVIQADIPDNELHLDLNMPFGRALSKVGGVSADKIQIYPLEKKDTIIPRKISQKTMRIIKGDNNSENDSRPWQKKQYREMLIEKIKRDAIDEAKEKVRQNPNTPEVNELLLKTLSMPEGKPLAERIIKDSERKKEDNRRAKERARENQ